MAFAPNRIPLRPAARSGAALLAVLCAACPPPGRGSKAEAGYRRAAPVIVALDRYHRERGSYPETLAELTPQWLPTPAPPAGLHYTRHDTQYELTFSYTGPGVNHCVYNSDPAESRRWQCHGYY